MLIVTSAREGGAYVIVGVHLFVGLLAGLCKKVKGGFG